MPPAFKKVSRKATLENQIPQDKKMYATLILTKIPRTPKKSVLSVKLTKRTPKSTPKRSDKKTRT